MPVVQPQTGHLTIGNIQRPDDGTGKFSIRCSMCGRVYMDVMIREGDTFMYELPGPLVPCHADGLDIGNIEDPWTRLLGFFENEDEKKKRLASCKGTYNYSVEMMDGMLYRISIQRMP
jgi:hypothetical protein